MASTSLGVLTLDLIAKVGGFTSGLDQAERQAKKSADAINTQIVAIGTIAGNIGTKIGENIAAGIKFAANAIPDLIDSVGAFQDIADKTGGSAAGFAAFAVSAKTADVSIESIATSSTRLSKALLDAGDASKPITAGLEALNVNIGDLKKQTPDQQIKTIANAFGNFADGANKAAVAQQIFGRSGADLLKFFKDYTDNGGDVSILTNQMISQADDFTDAQKRLRAEIEQFLGAASTYFIEPLTIIKQLLVDTAKEVLGADGSFNQLAANQAIQTFAENVGRSLAQAVDYVRQSVKEFQVLVDFVTQSAKAMGQVADLNFAGAAQTGADFRKKYGLDELGRKVADGSADIGSSAAKSFTQAYDAQLARNKADRNRAALNAINYGTGGDNRPQLAAVAPGRKGGGSHDDPTKKLLDNDLAAFKAQGDQAKELLAERNKILDLYNAQGLLSVKDYYAALQGNLDEATQAQAKSYDDQIDALKKFQAAASKQTDVADAQGKINKLEEDKAKLYRASGTAALESSIKQVQAQKAVTDAFNEVNAKILEYQGNLRAAADIRFDASNEKLLKQAVAEGNDEVVKRIGLLKQYTLAQADITKATDAFSLAQGDLSIQEDRITLAQQRGTMSEIQALTASGDARKAAVAVMQQELDALLAINDAVRTPQQNQAIDRLKLQLDQLKASVDPLGDKINSIFGDAAGSAFSDFITGAKSAKDAIKDFANQVVKSFADMIAKDLGKQLFSSLFGSSSDSGAGGIGGLLSGVLGKSSKGSGSGGLGGIGGLLGGLFGSSGGGSAALAGANAVGSAGGDALGAFIGLSGFASGGFTGVGAANDPAGIVHKGEYVLNAAQTQKIGVANLDRGNFGGGTVVQIHQTFAPGATRQTTDQAAMAAGNAARRATARNG